MSRIKRPNQVPVAPFNLRETGPLETRQALLKCDGLAYRAAFGTDPAKRETDVTIDRDPCPLCHTGTSPVEWAYTMKRENGVKVGYVYARCAVRPDEHRWSFRAPRPAPSTPSPSPSPLPLTNVAHEPTMTALLPASNPIETYIHTLVGSRLDEHEAKLLAMANEIASRTPMTVTLKIDAPDLQIVLEGLRHPMVDELCERYALGERTFMLVGPAGTGKTTIAIQLSQAIKASRVSVIACSEDMRRETFVGHKGYNVNDGTSPYQASVLVEDLRVTDSPTVTILEEVDAASPNALLTINALENGFLPTPDCAEMPRHARPSNHVLIATANTWGTAGSNQYVGRNQLDAATLDRYRVLRVDYDETLEKALVNDVDVYAALVDLRVAADSAGIRRVVSTRLGRRVVLDRAMTANKGKGARQVMSATLKASGWADVELTRVGFQN